MHVLLYVHWREERLIEIAIVQILCTLNGRGAVTLIRARKWPADWIRETFYSPLMRGAIFNIVTHCLEFSPCMKALRQLLVGPGSRAL